MQAMALLILLVAVTAGTARAQVCSGGADGGMDSTGNQCSARLESPNGVVRVELPAATAKMSGVQRRTQSARGGLAPSSDASKTVKIVAGSSSPCAGGMDATGSECSAGVTAVSVTPPGKR